MIRVIRRYLHAPLEIPDKKVFPVDNPSAIPLTDISPMGSLWAQNFIKAPLRGGGRCAPRASARAIATESQKWVRTHNLPKMTPKCIFGLTKKINLFATGLICY